jgi:fructose-1-phosphate kinase PfkB-like protein
VGYTLQSAGVADLTATLEDPTPVTLSGSAPESVQPETYTWPVGKKRRYGRFKIACNDQTTELTVRSLELFTRDSGKQ